MGCGDSKDRRSVTAKASVHSSPDLQVTGSAPQPSKPEAREEPDEETEVLRKGRKVEDIEPQGHSPAPRVPKEEKLDATQASELLEEPKPETQTVKFRTSKGNAMEDLELLEASLIEHSPAPRPRHSENEAVKTTSARISAAQLDDLLDDLKVPDVSSINPSIKGLAFPECSRVFTLMLRFTDPQTETEYHKYLKDTAQRTSVKLNYVLFALFLYLTIALTALSCLHDDLINEVLGDVGAYQLAGALILSGAVSVLVLIMYLIRNHRKWRLSFITLVSLCCTILLSLLATPVSFSLLSRTADSQVMTGLGPMLMLLVSVHYMCHGEFFVYGLTSSTCACLYLGITLCTQSSSQMRTVLDFFVLLFTCIVNSSSLYRTEKSIRLAYLRDPTYIPLHQRENMSFPSGNMSSILNTDLEDLLSRITNVQSVLLEASSSAAFPNIRHRLQTAHRDLDIVASKITLKAPSLFPVTIAEEVDEEDRIFIQQNYIPSRASDFENHSEKAIAVHVQADWIKMEYKLNDLQAVLNQLGKNWNFDMFFVQEVTQGKVLSVTGRYCLFHFDLITQFRISELEAENFFTAVENSYKPNPYHNSCHGADVLSSTLYFLTHSVTMNYLTNLETLGTIIAALCHDVSHGALTNRFLVNSRDSLAISCNHHLDNDISVLEMMHASLTFSLMRQENRDILRTLDADAWSLVRKVILKMILATGDLQM